MHINFVAVNKQGELGAAGTDKGFQAAITNPDGLDVNAVAVHLRATGGVKDAPGGGRDGFYEGEDHLIDIDKLVFSDRTVDVIDIL